MLRLSLVDLLANLNSLDEAQGLEECFLLFEHFLLRESAPEWKPASFTDLYHQNRILFDLLVTQYFPEASFQLHDFIKVLLQELKLD